MSAGSRIYVQSCASEVWRWLAPKGRAGDMTLPRHVVKMTHRSAGGDAVGLARAVRALRQAACLAVHYSRLQHAGLVQYVRQCTAVSASALQCPPVHCSVRG